MFGLTVSIQEICSVHLDVPFALLSLEIYDFFFLKYIFSKFDFERHLTAAILFFSMES